LIEMVNLLLGKVAATRRSDRLTELLSCCTALGIRFKHRARNWGKISSVAGRPIAGTKARRNCSLVSYCSTANEPIVITNCTAGVSSMKAFVLIVTFATAGVAGDEHTERIANFDDYQACAAAGRSLYPHQHWECVPANQPPQGGTNGKAGK
jgi:hypothetical protein